MSSFTELARVENMPVIHARRKDGALVIATRVPCRAEMMDSWGWVVTIVNGGGRMPEGEAIELLSDNTGGKYCRVLRYHEMLNYNERWGCADWTPGYPGAEGREPETEGLVERIQALQEALEQVPRQQDLTSLATSLQTISEWLKAISRETQPLSEQLQQLKESLSQDARYLEEKILQNDSELAQQILRAITLIEDQEQKWQASLEQLVTKQEQSIAHVVAQQLAPYQQRADEGFQQRLAHHHQALQDQLSALEQTVTATLSNQVTPAIDGLAGELRTSLQTLETRLLQTIQESKDKALEQLVKASSDISKIKSTMEDIFESEREEESTAEDKKLASSVRTLSDRYLNSIVTRINQYLRSFYEEARSSQKFSRVFFGINCACMCITLIIFFFILFRGANPALIGGGLITSTLSGLSSFFGAWQQHSESAAKRQLEGMANLMDIARIAHLQFMVERIDDEEWKKTHYSRILEQLLNKYVQI
uniref:Uncharacterized protein n=1 Tax=Thermogemmatispora argillosa TaxID=2045280 RepID=A0A455T507_9CHLR|nr:hypothetical protein KTA_32090 [Thermogemmatispora argillosa]